MELMKAIIYIGPKPEKNLRGYIMPFGEPVDVPATLAMEVLRHKHLFTADPAKVPDQRVSRIRLLRGEIKEAVRYQDQYTHEIAYARIVIAKKDKDLADRTIASCQKHIDWAQAKIDRNKAEIALLQIDPEESETVDVDEPGDGEPLPPKVDEDLVPAAKSIKRTTAQVKAATKA